VKAARISRPLVADMPAGRQFTPGTWPTMYG